jgi:lipoprotein NlpI
MSTATTMHISAATISLVSFLATATPSLAAQRDWNDCLGDNPQAVITGCTRIIQAPGEAKQNRASAYHNRGLAHATLGEPDRAITDFSEAIRLDSGNPDSFVSRGSAYYAKGDAGRAIANFDEALRVDPINVQAYFNRGLVNFYSRSKEAALDDLYQVRALDPTYPYAALWLDIVERRSNVRSRLPEARSQLDMASWPAPVIRLFMGEITAADTLAAANDPDAEKQKGQICEANFYSGQLALAQGDQQEALRLFRFSASNCPKTFTEWTAANAELRTLGVRSASRATGSRSLRQ